MLLSLNVKKSKLNHIEIELTKEKDIVNRAGKSPENSRR